MSHMVIFQTPDGNPGYNQFESLDEAVRFVEKLRNEQGVETARMFALEEVTFDFKPYFRVEVNPPMVGAGSPPPPSFSPPPRPQATEPAPPAFPEPPQPSAPPGDSSSPVGSEPVGVGAMPPPPTFMTAPVGVPPGDQADQTTTRRGLFGR